jgi:hypothetical protein
MNGINTVAPAANVATNVGTNVATNALTNAATDAGGGIFGGLLGNMGDFLNSDLFKLFSVLGMAGWGMNQQQNNYDKQWDLMKYAMKKDEQRYNQARDDNLNFAKEDAKKFTKVVQQDPNTQEYYVTDTTTKPNINWS